MLDISTPVPWLLSVQASTITEWGLLLLCLVIQCVLLFLTFNAFQVILCFCYWYWPVLRTREALCIEKTIWLLMVWTFISGVPRNFFRGGGCLTNSVENRGQREQRSGHGSQGFHSIYKCMKPVFWLGCYGCIFHRTGNLAQLCQNFGISGKGFEPPQNHPPPLTPTQ
jgi:hypothetical protein